MASLENTQQILDGAAVIAAGDTLGLNPEQTIAVANANREAVREKIRLRKEDRARRNENMAAAEAFLAEDDANFKAKGGLTPFQRQLARGGNVRVDIDDEGFAFGEDAQVIYDDFGRRIEREPRRPQDDDQSLTRAEKVRNDVLGADFLQPEEVAQQLEGRTVMVGGAPGYTRRVNGKTVRVPGKAPTRAVGGGGARAMQDALDRLEMAKEQYGFAAFGAEGEEMERVYYRLKDQLEGGGKRKDRDEARKAVLADAARRRGDASDGEIADAADRALENVRDERRKRVTEAVVLENGKQVKRKLQGPAQRQVIRRQGMPDKVNLVEPFAFIEQPELRFAPEANKPQPVFNAAKLQQGIVEDMVGRRQRNDIIAVIKRGMAADAKLEEEAAPS